MPWQRVDHWCAAFSKSTWTTLDVRDGEQGPLGIETTMCRVPVCTPTGGTGPDEVLFITRERLYTEMTTMHRAIRDKELRANENKKRTKRGGSPSPEAMAIEIWDTLDSSLIRRFPEDFYGAEIKDAETIELHEGKAKVVLRPIMGLVELEMGSQLVELEKEQRAQLALAAHECGRRGPVLIPRDPAACSAALMHYREYAEHMRTEFAQQAAEKTASEKLAAKVLALLEKRLGQFGNPGTTTLS